MLSPPVDHAVTDKFSSVDLNSSPALYLSGRLRVSRDVVPIFLRCKLIQKHQEKKPKALNIKIGVGVFV